MKHRARGTYALERPFIIVVLFCILLLFLPTFAVASSGPFDYEAVKNEIQTNKVSGYILEENPQTHNAFIHSERFSISKCSFEHENSSNAYYSYFYNDWIVLNYDSNNPIPIWRLWIYYSSIESIDAKAVTFSFAGTDYTFEDIFYPASSLSKYENGDCRQEIVIIFGEEHLGFISDLQDYIFQPEVTSYDEMMALPKVKVTFHGTKDISTELPNTFLVDFIDASFIPLGDMTLADVLSMSEAPNRMKTSSSNKAAEEEGTLILGENGEFAIATNGMYTYNTRNSDLTGYETTDRYIFNIEKNMVCAVHSYTNTAFISYYPTESNKNLSRLELLEKCFLAHYSESALFSDKGISLKFDLPYLRVTSIGETIFGTVYYIDTFVVLENGIIVVSGNSTNDDSVYAFVDEIVNSLKTKADNNAVSDFIYPKLDISKVYYIPGEDTYHSVKSCDTLANEKTLYMSSLDYAVSKKLGPCRKCVDPNQIP